MSRSRVLNLAVISDIHVGNRRLDHDKLVENLSTAFPDNDETGQLDLIVFAGDIFDDLLNAVSPALALFEVWWAGFLRMCKRRDIAVRILEGTKSHDWGQGSRLVAINDKLGHIGADLVYIDELSIRYEERFDMNFLFVPDDLHHDTQVTLDQVRELLRAKNLDKVDFAFMHGSFKYQLPAHVKAPHHDEHAYLDLVKYLIFIGHIHVHSQYDRIWAQGSFDRISHGEESAKGHLRVKLYSDDQYEIEFVENKGAHVFKTLDIRGKPIEESFRFIRSKTKDLEPGSSVRLLVEPTHPILGSLRQLIVDYPLIKWSTKEDKVEKQAREQKELIDQINYTPIVINKDNIMSLMRERLIKLDLEAEVLSVSENILEQLR